jgi:hypothetical protein
MGPVTVRQGKRYRAWIHLGFIEQAASNATVSEKFTEAGFTRVQVQGSGHDRWAYGFWMHPDKTVEEGDLPEQIKEVVEVPA